MSILQKIRQGLQKLRDKIRSRDTLGERVSHDPRGEDDPDPVGKHQICGFEGGEIRRVPLCKKKDLGIHGDDSSALPGRQEGFCCRKSLCHGQSVKVYAQDLGFHV